MILTSVLVTLLLLVFIFRTLKIKQLTKDFNLKFDEIKQTKFHGIKTGVSTNGRNYYRDTDENKVISKVCYEERLAVNEEIELEKRKKHADAVFEFNQDLTAINKIHKTLTCALVALIALSLIKLLF